MKVLLRRFISLVKKMCLNKKQQWVPTPDFDHCYDETML